MKLLRALQERRIRRVGGSDRHRASRRGSWRPPTATSSDEVRAGRFREDLFYRLNVIQIRLPPLRERREDLPLFLDHFLARFAGEQGRPRLRLSPEAERAAARVRLPRQRARARERRRAGGDPLRRAR